MDAGLWILTIILTLGFASMFFMLAIAPIIEQHDLNKWCIEKGFDSGEYNPFTWGHSYCISVNNNTMIKSEVDTCIVNNHRDRCFIKNQDANYTADANGVNSEAKE